MASDFSSAEADAGTTASENPLRYLRVEYSQTAEYAVRKMAKINRTLPAYQTIRKYAVCERRNSSEERFPRAFRGGAAPEPGDPFGTANGLLIVLAHSPCWPNRRAPSRRGCGS